MKRFFFLLTLVGALSLSSMARAETSPLAQSGRFGLGLGTGTLATGLTGKYYFNNTFALQGTAGFWYWNGRGLVFNLDAIFEMPKIASNNAVSLNWQLGFGGAIGLYDRYYDRYYNGPLVLDSVAFGLEGVAGLGLQFKSVPIEIVADFRPTIYFGDRWGQLYPGFGASIRYFFK